MKFTVSFKDPDALNCKINGKKAQDIIDKFIRYGEYVTIEFDTEAGTATVVACAK